MDKKEDQRDDRQGSRLEDHVVHHVVHHVVLVLVLVLVLDCSNPQSYPNPSLVLLQADLLLQEERRCWL